MAMLYLQTPVKILSFVLLSTPLVATAMELLAFYSSNSYQQVAYSKNALVYQATVSLPSFFFILPLLSYIWGLDRYMKKMYPGTYKVLMVENQLLPFLMTEHDLYL